jgi:hypothetical protein
MVLSVPLLPSILHSATYTALDSQSKIPFEILIIAIIHSSSHLTLCSLPERWKYSAKAQRVINATKVDYRRLGQSGLRVSVPILGAIGFGDTEGNPMGWVLPEKEVS